jgi:glycosyltransferase involved in cell wall biosynthesis
VSAPPPITVVTTTYNWPSVLRLAIPSVLAQSFADFEYLIVGDCCTDETADVVASFDDPRIRWHNLEENSGNQSGPNRWALERARGGAIAYLNHDDLWFPHHLQTLVDAMHEHRARVAHTMCLEISPPGYDYRNVQGMPRTGFFGPDEVMIMTSTLMHDAALAKEVGGWIDWRELAEVPTIHFIRRLVSAVGLHTVQEVSAIKFNSGDRKDSYRLRVADEQARYVELMRSDPDLRYREVLQALRSVTSGQRAPKIPHSPPPEHPPAGWQIEQWRLIRGLSPMLDATAAEKLDEHADTPGLRRDMFRAGDDYA